MRYPRFFVLIIVSAICKPLGAFETTKVLPKGIRNLNIRTINTSTNTKTDSRGAVEPLAEALWKPLKFKNIISSESGLKKTQLEALLLQQGWSTEDSVGDFTADLDAHINVWAPIFAYGMTNKLTFAVALPIYSASTDIEVGFSTNRGAERLLATLTAPSMSNSKSAREVVEKFQNFKGRLNQKLEENNYQAFSKWSDTGIGDMSLLAKYLALDNSYFQLALSAGITAPTGRKDDPNILTDLAFGDGQWDLFSQITTQQWLSSQLTLSQFVKYTYQAPDRKDVRLKTFEETIEVELDSLDYKLGDKVDGGLAIQYEQPLTGFEVGLGFLAFRKFGDSYTTNDFEAKKELQRATDQNANYWQTKLGYSTVEAFRRGDFALPLMASIEYRKQMKSRNVPITDFTQVEIRLFF